MTASSSFRLTLLSLFTLTFVLVYGTADMLGSYLPYRIPMPHLPWPFLPQLAPLYLSLNILILLSFLRAKPSSLPSLFLACICQTVIAGVFFLAFPLEAIPAPSGERSLWFQIADTVNLDGNYLPSLHVAFAFSCAYFYRHALTWLWFFGITASTVLTHQHYLIDLLAAIALAGWLCKWSNGKGKPWAVALSELVRCSLRHPRYALIATGLVLQLFKSPTKGKRALFGFCYLQRIDDFLDGDLSPPAELEPYNIAHNEHKVWSKEADHDSLDSHLALLRPVFLQLQPPAEIVQQVIGLMMKDRLRVKDKQLLNEEELWLHLELTFVHSLKLLLWADYSSLKIEDVPSLPKLLAWCSLVRDLEDDLHSGLVNIPREVWESDDLEDWFSSHAQRAEKLFESCAQELDTLETQAGKGSLLLFHKSVRKYLTKHDSRSMAALVQGFNISTQETFL